MKKKHPATPPPELVEDWIELAKPEPWKRSPDPNVIATLAARWGYEQHEKALLDAMHAVVPQPYEPEENEVDEYGYPQKLGDFYAS